MKFHNFDIFYNFCYIFDLSSALACRVESIKIAKFWGIPFWRSESMNGILTLFDVWWVDKWVDSPSESVYTWVINGDDLLIVHVSDIFLCDIADETKFGEIPFVWSTGNSHGNRENKLVLKLKHFQNQGYRIIQIAKKQQHRFAYYFVAKLYLYSSWCCYWQLRFLLLLVIQLFPFLDMVS